MRLTSPQLIQPVAVPILLSAVYVINTVGQICIHQHTEERGEEWACPCSPSAACVAVPERCTPLYPMLMPLFLQEWYMLDLRQTELPRRSQMPFWSHKSKIFASTCEEGTGSRSQVDPQSIFLPISNWQSISICWLLHMISVQNTQNF